MHDCRTSQYAPPPTTAPREPTTKAVFNFAKGIVFLITHTNTSETWFWTPSTVFPSPGSQETTFTIYFPSFSVILSISHQVHESDEERGGLGVHPPPMSYSSTSTLSDSVVTTPAFAAFPLHAESQDATRSFSPRTTAFPVVIESSTLTSTAGSEPPTRPSSPPDTSGLLNDVPPVHKYTANAPALLKLGPEVKRFFPESNTSPLRINKRIPTSPPVGASQILAALPLAASSLHNPSSTNDTPINPLAPSSATPNTSHSFASSSSPSYDHHSSADAQIGIGLSLLQDLANGMDSSDEDEDEEDEVRWRLRYSRWSVHSLMSKDDEAAGYKAALARVGHRTQDSMDDGTVEGLMYARSEEDEHEEKQPLSTTLDAGKPSPIPFTTSPQSALLSLPSLPVSPSLGGTNDRERRPPLAASAASTGSWEGTSDIYDGYRYSRFSMTSKVSTMSSRVSVSGAASGVTPTPPVPESRLSMRGGNPSAQGRIQQSPGRIRLYHKYWRGMVRRRKRSRTWTRMWKRRKWMTMGVGPCMHRRSARP